MNRCVVWATKKIAVCLSVMLLLAAGGWSLPVMAETSTEEQTPMVQKLSAETEGQAEALEKEIAQLNADLSTAKTALVLGIIGASLAVLAIAGASVAIFMGMKRPTEKELFDPEKFATRDDLNALSQNVAQQIDRVKNEEMRNARIKAEKQTTPPEEKRKFVIPDLPETEPVKKTAWAASPVAVEPKVQPDVAVKAEEPEIKADAVVVGKLKANFEPQIRDRIWLTEGRGYLLYEDNTLEPEQGRGSNTLENFAQNGLLRLFDAQVNGQTYTYQQIINGEYPRNQYYQPGDVLKKAVVKQESGGEYSLVHPRRIEMRP